jgi:Ca-activated chloride channel family protein
MMLRDSKHKGNITYNKIIELADDAMDDDEFGYRAEFIELVKRAKKMDKKQR